MSAAVTLTLRDGLTEPLDVAALNPDRCAALSAKEIARLPVWFGRQSAMLGDFFAVAGGHSSRVLVEGPLSRVDRLGAGMTGGELLIDGDTGAGTGAAMSQGRLDVRGSVADDAGVAMSGGTLWVRGNAGDRLGAAPPGASRGMTGGEIVVEGSAGADAAARCRRGLVVVCGRAGARAARSVIAGTLVVLDDIGPEAGRGNKRGSLVAGGAIEVPASYRYACTYEPPYLRLLARYLRSRGVDVTRLEGPYRRYCGDAGALGKGEILHRAPG